MAIDPRLLRILLAVAREGSLSAAATRLNMTQPSVSIAVAQLEDRVGQRVVTRDRRGAVLTSAGETLARHARAVENILVRVEQDLLHQQAGVEGPLALGGTTGALLAIVPRVTASLQAEGRIIDMALHDATDRDLIDMLRARAVELALCPSSSHGVPRDIEEILLLREPFLLVAAPHVDLPRKSISLSAAASRPWVMPLAQGATRSQLEAIFLSADVPLPRNVIRCDLLATMKELVRHTKSLALLPKAVVESELAAGLFQTVPLIGGPPPRRLVVRKLRDEPLSPQAARFLALAQTLQEL